MSERKRILHIMHAAGLEKPISPQLDGDQVPWCDDRCAYHDGKRCELLGTRPQTICLPAVHILVDEVERLQAEEHSKLS